jgi:glucose-6-phosphate isomerase
MPLSDEFLSAMAAPMRRALLRMQELEAGAVANLDEGRMVGHYWLRTPELAPQPGLAAAIQQTVHDATEFARAVHAGEIHPARGGRFRHLVIIGIGGSALGPQLVAAALERPDAPLRPVFVDNTDPDGIDLALASLGEGLAETLAVVISKSGGTVETRNGMLEVQAAYRRAGLAFAPHAIAITSSGSSLDRTAEAEGWLRRFPMWDWVGGRTSVTSAVGLVPLALLGVDVGDLLSGARVMDSATRADDPADNPAALLALAWYASGNGRGDRDMVILPYKDRLCLLSRYLQQLVMESIGKRLDRQGRVVHQGLTVYGNKGSTDQHAYVQQLRDGPDRFFVTFLEVLRERAGAPLEVEPDVTAGDYLLGFLRGTHEALAEQGRGCLVLTVPEVSARVIGALIALYERAVGLYAELVDTNAYHQPGVEAGKKAAVGVIDVQRRLLAHLRQHPGELRLATELASAVGADPETVFVVLRHLAANPGRFVTVSPARNPADVRFAWKA